MTTNITRFTMDIGELVLGRDPAGIAEARSRSQTTWPVIVGFGAGAGLGAGCVAAAGRWSLALPAGLALLGMVLGLALNLG